MRKVAVTIVAAAALALAPAAYGHPSENRAETAFHGGPHCHVNVHSENLAFPSHMAHLASGPGNVFNAVDCPD